MKYAIVSDIHANLDALERVLADAQSQGAEKVVCLGDIVGYGPQPAAALARVRDAAQIALAGNHDDAVSGRGDASSFIDLAGDAVTRHRDALSPADIAYLASLPYTAQIEGALCTHGDIVDPPKFYYIESAEDAAANFPAGDWQLLFAGHTHVPRIFLIGASGKTYSTAPQDFTLEEGKRYIVNPGSVGYPREADGKCYSSYVIYDSDERTVSFRFLPFSVASVMQRGTNPKRVRKTILAAAAALLSAAAAIATFLLAPKTTVADNPALVVARQTLELGGGENELRANLELGKGSPGVILKIEFLDAQRNPLAAESVTVKKSSTKAIKIPPASARASLKVLKLKADDSPQIHSFRPAATAKR